MRWWAARRGRCAPPLRTRGSESLPDERLWYNWSMRNCMERNRHGLLAAVVLPCVACGLHVDVPPFAMPEFADTIEAIKRLEPPSRVRFLLRVARYGGQDGVSGACGRLCALRVHRWRISPPKRSFCGASLEYAVMHCDEAERIREERTCGCVGFAEGRRSRGARPAGARMSVV